jgi:hypothetical protein
MKRDKFFILVCNFRGFRPPWLGGHDTEDQLTSLVTRKHKEKMPAPAEFLLSPVYSIRPISLWNGDTHIQGGFVLALTYPLWKHPHRHTQRCVFLISEHFSIQSS